MKYRIKVKANLDAPLALPSDIIYEIELIDDVLTLPNNLQHPLMSSGHRINLADLDDPEKQKLTAFFHDSCTFYDDDGAASDAEQQQFLNNLRQQVDPLAMEDSSSFQFVDNANPVLPIFTILRWIGVGSLILLGLALLACVALAAGMISLLVAPELPGVEIFSGVFNFLGWPSPVIAIDKFAFAPPVIIATVAIVGLIVIAAILFKHFTTTPSPGTVYSRDDEQTCSIVADDSSLEYLLAGHGGLTILQRIQQLCSPSTASKEDPRNGIPPVLPGDHVNNGIC